MYKNINPQGSNRCAKPCHKSCLTPYHQSEISFQTLFFSSSASLSCLVSMHIRLLFLVSGLKHGAGTFFLKRSGKGGFPPVKLLSLKHLSIWFSQPLKIFYFQRPLCIMKLWFDLCFIYELHGKLSDPPNGRNFGQNCFADPEAGSILLQREKIYVFLVFCLKPNILTVFCLKNGIYIYLCE